MAQERKKIRGGVREEKRREREKKNERGRMWKENEKRIKQKTLKIIIKPSLTHL